MKMKMKWYFMAAVVAVFATAATWATVTLNSSQVRAYSEGGATVESDSVASATASHWDYGSETIEITIRYGSTSAGAFSPGQNVHPMIVTLNAQTGVVSLSDGTIINLTAAQQSAIVSMMKTQQNTIENALINWGILSGTQMPN